MISYDLDDISGILIIKAEGEVTEQDIIEKINFVCDSPEIPNNIKLFTDFTRASLLFGPDAIERITTYVLEKVVRFNFVKEALLIKEANITALAMLYQKGIEGTPVYKCRIFSDYESALHWLKND